MKRWILNFCVANVCGLFPLLWIALGWMPDQVKVRWKGEDSPTFSPCIVAGETMLQGETVGTWEGGIVWRFYLREGMGWKELAFRLPPGKGPENIGRIDLQKWRMLRFGKNGGDLVPAGGGKNAWRFANSRFSSSGFASRGVGEGLMVLEVLLLGLAWIFAKRHCVEHWKTLAPPVVLVAFALALLMEVALPLQSYWADQSAYPFSPGALFGAIAVRFTWMLVLSAVAMGMLCHCFGRWVLGAVVAFGVCVYLEAGVLSAGLPELDGNWWFYQDKTRAMWDAAVWAGVFVLFAALHPVLKKRYGLVALGLSLMVCASMFDVKREEKADASMLMVQDFVPIETVIRSVSYSTKRNVLVFVVDSLEREQAQAIMEDPEAGPKLREQFRGFTEYIDNIGAWDKSFSSVANMFTGQYPEEPVRLADYFVAPYSRDSVLGEYLKAGFSVFMATSTLGYGWTNHRHVVQAHGQREGVFSTRLAGELGWTLPEVVRFRACPFAGKFTIAMLTGLRVPERESWSLERIAFPAMAKGRVEDCPGCFVFCHTGGVHWPVRVDRRGLQLPRPNDTDEGCKEAGIWVLGQLGNLFDALREKGVYDKSLILVFADHGNHDWGGGIRLMGGVPGNARPFLWAKAPGSTHDFSSDNAPTHHGKIAELLEKACKADLPEEKIRDTLLSFRREYCVMTDGGIEVWTVEQEGSCSKRMEKMASREVHPLALDHLYRFDHKHFPKDGRDVDFIHGAFWQYPCWLSSHPMEVRFRVADSKKSYVVRFSIKMTKERGGTEDTHGAFLHLGQKGKEETFIKVMSEYHTDVKLHGIHPDPSGNVEIVGERENGLNARVYMLDLLISEE